MRAALAPSAAWICWWRWDPHQQSWTNPVQLRRGAPCSRSGGRWGWRWLNKPFHPWCWPKRKTVGPRQPGSLPVQSPGVVDETANCTVSKAGALCCTQPDPHQTSAPVFAHAAPSAGGFWKMQQVETLKKVHLCLQNSPWKSSNEGGTLGE